MEDFWGCFVWNSRLILLLEYLLLWHWILLHTVGISFYSVEECHSKCVCWIIHSLLSFEIVLFRCFFVDFFLEDVLFLRIDSLLVWEELRWILVDSWLKTSRQSAVISYIVSIVISQGLFRLWDLIIIRVKHLVCWSNIMRIRLMVVLTGRMLIESVISSGLIGRIEDSR